MVDGKKLDVRNDSWLEDYEDKIRRIGDEYSNRGLKVLLGVELDCFPGVVEHLPERFFSTDFDFILGAVHLIDHIAISASERAESAFERYSMQEMGAVYFRNLADAAECGHIDILAHLDLYRRFGEEFYGESISDLWKEHIDHLSSKMKKNGIGFEINTSPLRRGGEFTMPSPDLAEALIERGISAVTVGSDAHTPRNVGEDLNVAVSLMKRLGLEAITRYRHRRPSKMRI
jgi:histidinol-phosphatase (PHP family)